jgi:hypothetical protein
MLPGRFGGYNGYWLPDPVRDRALVVSLFYGTDPSAFSQTTVEIVNASGSRDVLADTLARLSALGLRVVRVTASAETSDALVVVHHVDPAVAHVVAGITGARIVRTPAADGPGLTVVLSRTRAAPDPTARR